MAKNIVVAVQQLSAVGAVHGFSSSHLNPDRADYRYREKFFETA